MPAGSAGRVFGRLFIRECQCDSGPAKIVLESGEPGHPAMKSFEKVTWIVLLALLFAALGAVIFTHSWTDYRERLRAMRQAEKGTATAVDTGALDTAQQLAPLAMTHIEQDYATQALRLGDHSVDLAFAAALHDAAENPAPLAPQAQQLSARVKSLAAAVAADQARVAQFTAAMGHAKGKRERRFANSDRYCAGAAGPGSGRP